MIKNLVISGGGYHVFNIFWNNLSIAKNIYNIQNIKLYMVFQLAQ